MINWRSYFRNSSDANSYAKDAKVLVEASEPESFADLHPDSGNTLSFKGVLKGWGIELWCDSLGERLWLVEDEEDAALAGERRGSIYTAHEVSCLVRVGDPETVAEIHRWKRQFDGIVSEYLPEGATQRGSRLQNAPEKREGPKPIQNPDNTRQRPSTFRATNTSCEPS
jgi:hypothetical protein